MFLTFNFHNSRSFRPEAVIEEALVRLNSRLGWKPDMVSALDYVLGY